MTPARGRLATALIGVAMLATGSRAVGRPVHAEATASQPCLEPEHRRLDFWVGDWDVYDADAPTLVVARTHVEVILGGCALRETYEGANGLVGESLSMYDASRKVWHQTWITNRGQRLALEGSFQGNLLSLQGPQVSANGQEVIVRGVWMPQAEGVRETAHTSSDGGATWRLLFDILFRRHEAGAGAPQPPAPRTGGCR